MSLLEEAKANTHLTHLEELVLTQGPKGFEMAKRFLLQLLETLKGNSKSSVQTSVKWDGAPAIFAGINPENGKFFVGTKSIFNKVPKINYTLQDIITNHGHAPGLVDKLTKALKYLPSLGIKNILQGDFMFDDGMLDVAEIDGEPHYRFKPNTIVYAVPVNSDLGKEIGKSKFGIVFHTTYDSLDGGASFGADISGLKRVPGIWFDDAFFTDDTGTVTLTSEEEKRVVELVTKADAVNKEIDYNDLPSDLLNIYINSEIKSGEFLQSPEKSFEGFMNWYSTKLKVKIDKLKSERGKDRARAKGQDQLELFKSKQGSVLRLFEVSRLLFEAKNIFIAKYNNAVYNTKHFIDDGSGDLIASNPEGYVAVDHEGNGVKFVDRLEFSRANFMIDKDDKFTQNESLTVYWGSDGVSTTHTLKEWSESLPPTTKTNKVLFNMLRAGVPITSVELDADTVKESLAAAVNWQIEEGRLKSIAKKAWDKVSKKVPGASSLDPAIAPLFTEGSESEPAIVYIPGGFKPPHKGHLSIVHQAAKKWPHSPIRVVSGRAGKTPKERETGRGGITLEMAADVWSEYFKRDPLLSNVDVGVTAITKPLVALDTDGRPRRRKKDGEIITTYSPIEKIAQDASRSEETPTIAVVYSKKDEGYGQMVRNVLKGLDQEGKLLTLAADVERGSTDINLSSTDLRRAIKENDFETFKYFLPEFYNEDEKGALEVFTMLGGQPGLEEASAMAGGAVQIGAGRAPDVAGSKRKRKMYPKNFLEEEEIVTEVVDYLLGITVG